MRDYFVIYYCTETGRLVVDDEEAVRRFPGGLMQEPTTKKWVDQSDYGDLDSEAAKKVRTVVSLYNDVLKGLPEP